MSGEDREFWLAVRQALLMLLDALERRLGQEPRTSEIRRWWREQRNDAHAAAGGD